MRFHTVSGYPAASQARAKAVPMAPSPSRAIRGSVVVAEVPAVVFVMSTRLVHGVGTDKYAL
ncbi:hypothetical protein GCM10009551_029210 [Nocardiopsis tropica]